MYVSEIFRSIQGESTYAGLPCIFVRLSGCNLKCRWCDTDYALEAGDGCELTLEEVLERVGEVNSTPQASALPTSKTDRTGTSRSADGEGPLIEITGGEPLSHSETPKLAQELLDRGYRVMVETNGTHPISLIPDGVIRIVDVKCPSSGHGGSFLMDNLSHLTDLDEVKFVVEDYGDFEFARAFISKNLAGRTVLLSPVHGVLDPEVLSRWILDSSLEVRIQTQLHKEICTEIEYGTQGREVTGKTFKEKGTLSGVIPLRQGA